MHSFLFLKQRSRGVWILSSPAYRSGKNQYCFLPRTRIESVNKTILKTCLKYSPYNEANLGWQKHKTVIGLFSSQSVPSITLFLNLILNNADVFVLGSCTMVFIITTRIFRPKGLNLFICNARNSLRFAVKFSCYHISLTLSTSLSWLGG